ncbi:hypothetical protein BCR42DRAFT_414474 [Absidia repens]|uniref:Uncharacterized protein n=1 Tax=Absidia repens TaxID=90262 RepID=A0A1X2IJ55_9FUNG|nr:hypothetical protein BCR42DRAFT_414474 [Absidia repens]
MFDHSWLYSQLRKTRKKKVTIIDELIISYCLCVLASYDSVIVTKGKSSVNMSLIHTHTHTHHAVVNKSIHYLCLSLLFTQWMEDGYLALGFCYSNLLVASPIVLYC